MVRARARPSVRAAADGTMAPDGPRAVRDARPGRRLVPAGERRARRSSSIRSATRGGSSRSPRRAAGGSATSSRPTSTTTTCPARSRRGPRRARRSWRRRAGGYEFEHRAVDEGDCDRDRRRCGSPPGRRRATRRSTSPGSSRDRRAGAGADDRRRPLAAFTGGSLLVGSAGRTDLLGPALTDALTRDQQRSLARLAELPDAAQVLPTHGAGSFCSAGPGERESRLHHRRRAVREPDVPRSPAAPPATLPRPGARRARPLSRLLRRTWPRINRRGPRVLGRLILPPALGPGGVRGRGGEAARRSSTPATASAFAAGHLAGRAQHRAGRRVRGLRRLAACRSRRRCCSSCPDGAPTPSPTRRPSCSASATSGSRAGSRAASRRGPRSGRPLPSYETTTMRQLHDERARRRRTTSVLLDVRQPIEWANDGVVPGAERIFVADLPARLAELPARRAGDGLLPVRPPGLDRGEHPRRARASRSGSSRRAGRAAGRTPLEPIRVAAPARRAAPIALGDPLPARATAGPELPARRRATCARPPPRRARAARAGRAIAVFATTALDRRSTSSGSLIPADAGATALAGLRPLDAPAVRAVPGRPAARSSSLGFRDEPAALRAPPRRLALGRGPAGRRPRRDDPDHPRPRRAAERSAATTAAAPTPLGHGAARTTSSS